ncbi:UCH domain-containing protein, partial [Cephalotus follicularis]
SSSPVNMEYELYSFIVHAGEIATSGHYYTFVSTPSSWYKLNDEDLDAVDVQTVLKQEAYILFYRSHTLDMTALPSYSDSSMELPETVPLIPLGIIHCLFKFPSLSLLTYFLYIYMMFIYTYFQRNVNLLYVLLL